MWKYSGTLFIRTQCSRSIYMYIVHSNYHNTSKILRWGFHQYRFLIFWSSSSLIYARLACAVVQYRYRLLLLTARRGLWLCVCQSVSASVYWSRPWAMQKRMYPPSTDEMPSEAHRVSPMNRECKLLLFHRASHCLLSSAHARYVTWRLAFTYFLSQELRE